MYRITLQCTLLSLLTSKYFACTGLGAVGAALDDHGRAAGPWRGRWPRAARDAQPTLATDPGRRRGFWWRLEDERHLEVLSSNFTVSNFLSLTDPDCSTWMHHRFFWIEHCASWDVPSCGLYTVYWLLKHIFAEGCLLVSPQLVQKLLSIPTAQTEFSALCWFILGSVQWSYLCKRMLSQLLMTHSWI